jgi:hypothetical protein
MGIFHRRIPAGAEVAKRSKRAYTKGGELAHYWKIVLALTRTAWIMGEIDKVGVV